MKKRRLPETRECGSEVDVKPSREFSRREAIHITAFSVVVGVFTILGAIAAIGTLVYEIVRNRKKK